MNIVDFLIANYHWLLAIILLTIVTIIGFLADKKKNDKKKENTRKQPKSEATNITQEPAQPMQYQQENLMVAQPNMTQNDINNFSTNQNVNQINNGSMNQMNNTNNQNLGTIPETMENLQNNNNNHLGTIPQPLNYTDNIESNNNNNQMNTPQPIENIAPQPVQEPMYQPLEEQKPHFEPQPIPSFDTMNQVQNQPSQMINNSMSFGNQNMMPQQPANNVGGQMSNPEPMMQTPMYNQNTNIQGNNNYGIPNMIPNPIQNTQSPNPIPIPQPITPQPIMTNPMQSPEPMNQMPTYNMNQPVPNQNGFAGNQNQYQNGFVGNQNPQPQQPMMQPNQQQMPTPMTSVNFVYGPQNNNPNM